MSIRNKIGNVTNKIKPTAMIALSIAGSIFGKMLAEKFEKQISINEINVNVYNYLINSLSDSAISDFISRFNDKHIDIEIDKDEQLKEENLEYSKLDKAYDFLLNNVEVQVNDYIDICFQKMQDKIIITYIFNEEYSNEFYNKGLSGNEVFALANTIGETNAELLCCLQNNLGFVVPIDIRVYTYYGDLLIHVESGQLKELNGIRPSLKPQDL